MKDIVFLKLYDQPKHVNQNPVEEVEIRDVGLMPVNCPKVSEAVAVVSVH